MWVNQFLRKSEKKSLNEIPSVRLMTSNKSMLRSHFWAPKAKCWLGYFCINWKKWVKPPSLGLMTSNKSMLWSQFWAPKSQMLISLLLRKSEKKKKFGWNPLPGVGVIEQVDVVKSLLSPEKPMLISSLLHKYEKKWAKTPPWDWWHRTNRCCEASSELEKPHVD